jgi:anti-anti-sigma factor
MDDFYTVRQSGKHTVIEFQTASLMNPQDLERVGSQLFRMVDEEKRTHVVLDFGKVKYLSSQAIGIILTLNKKLTGGSAGGDGLVLCGVGPQLMQLLKITRLDRILTIKSSQQDAVAK